MRSEGDAKTGTLLVAATGGHLEQLFRISRRISPVADPVTWVTHEDSQSISLLVDQEVRTVPYIPPRGVRQVIGTLPGARTIIQGADYDRIVSTGAAIALPFFAIGLLHGIPCHYIESAARAEGPSLTGRIVSRMPGVRLYSQYRSWARGNWNYRGSLFDSFSATEGPDRPVRRVHRVRRVNRDSQDRQGIPGRREPGEKKATGGRGVKRGKPVQGDLPDPGVKKGTRGRPM